ncbi:hypothetical protein ACLK5F_003256 [Vibrio fluvialis]
MHNEVDGVLLEVNENTSCFHILTLSDDLKDLIRSCFQEICHGSVVAEHRQSFLYNYKSTLVGFLDRYSSKPKAIQIGLIGELLAHILLTKVACGYEASSAYFNLEEKSIKKGFDILLCNIEDNSIWITEVKSGELHKNKDHNATTKELLHEAKRDLNKRLNEQEPQYWINAINHVRATVSEAKDYKKALIQSLDTDFGSKTISGEASSKDKNVILVSNIFSTTEKLIDLSSAESINEDIAKKKMFKNSCIVSIQKSTYQKVVDFLTEESQS